MRRKKLIVQYADEKRWVFSFDIKEESEDDCLTGAILWSTQNSLCLIPFSNIPSLSEKKYSR